MSNDSEQDKATEELLESPGGSRQVVRTAYAFCVNGNNYKQLQTESDWSGRVPVNLISQTVVNGMRSLKASSPVQLLLAVLLISGA